MPKIQTTANVTITPAMTRVSIPGGFRRGLDLPTPECDRERRESALG